MRTNVPDAQTSSFFSWLEAPVYSLNIFFPSGKKNRKKISEVKKREKNPEVQHGYEYFAGGQLLTVFSAGDSKVFAFFSICKDLSDESVSEMRPQIIATSTTTMGPWWSSSRTQTCNLQLNS